MASDAPWISRPPFPSRLSCGRTPKRCCTVRCIHQKCIWYNPDRRIFLQPDLRRRWVDADTPPSSYPKDRFLMVSYNILGDRNASKHRDLYSHVPFDFLRWDKRRKLLCEELQGWEPHVVCLQEVDRYDDIFRDMKREGYVGSYQKRTGGLMDGCAVFWKDNMFHLLEGSNIEFQAFGFRDNVAQLLVFEMNKTASRRVVIGNIHVLFNPNRGDIKLGQIRLLLRKAHILSEKWGNAPIVLAGDFNCTPQSGIYKYLSSAKLNLKMHDKRELSGQKSARPVYVFGIGRKSYGDRCLKDPWTKEELIIASGKPNCTMLEHPLKLYSSYANVKRNPTTRGPNGEPLATSYHSKFFGTVDYLWYSNGLAPLRVLDTLPIDTLRKTGGLPTENLGSDHLALACEFAFTVREEQEHDPEEYNESDGDARNARITFI